MTCQVSFRIIANDLQNENYHKLSQGKFLELLFFFIFDHVTFQDLGFLGPAGGLRLLLANIFDSDEEEEDCDITRLNNGLQQTEPLVTGDCQSDRALKSKGKL